MEITKLGHCCLLIKIGEVTILTDPGAFSDSQNSVKDVDVILITHEHPDHLHTESVQAVLQNNPDAKIYTNSGVGKKLEELGVPYTLLEGRDSTNLEGIEVEAFDCKHEEIFEEIGQVQNTGYFIGGKLFYPGDSFCDPEKKVEVLALPVAGPWCSIPDAIRYALKLKPNKAFPVHDGMIEESKMGAFHRVPNEVLTKNGIKFIPMLAGDTEKF